jgi:hypothetical protein
MVCRATKARGRAGSKERPVSLQTIVSGGIGRRLRRRRAVGPAELEPRATEVAIDLSGNRSMRILETGLALTAIATALLIGLGR